MNSLTLSLCSQLILPPLSPGNHEYVLLMFFILIFFPLSECRLNGVIPYVTFQDRLLSLSIIHLRFIQVIACINSWPSLLLSSVPLYRCTHGLSIHPLKHICFIFNVVACEQFCSEHLCTGFCVNISFLFYRIILESEIAGSYGKCMFNFRRSY